MTVNMGDHSTYLLPATVALASTLLILSYIFYKKVSGSRRREVGKVSLIRLYPLKSGPWIEVKEAELTPSGLRHGNIYDRLVHHLVLSSFYS